MAVIPSERKGTEHIPPQTIYRIQYRTRNKDGKDERDYLRYPDVNGLSGQKGYDENGKVVVGHKPYVIAFESERVANFLNAVLIAARKKRIGFLRHGDIEFIQPFSTLEAQEIIMGLSAIEAHCIKTPAYRRRWSRWLRLYFEEAGEGFMQHFSDTRQNRDVNLGPVGT